MKTPCRADYTHSIEGTVIAIVDLDQGRKSRSAGAVTNDMENVLDEIRAQIGSLWGYSVIYCDSRGIWDGVRLEQGEVEFYSLNETDPTRAATRLLHVLGTS